MADKEKVKQGTLTAPVEQPLTPDAPARPPSKRTADPELMAMMAVSAALEKLSEPARSRVMVWANQKFNPPTAPFWVPEKFANQLHTDKFLSGDNAG